MTQQWQVCRECLLHVSLLTDYEPLYQPQELRGFLNNSACLRVLLLLLGLLEHFDIFIEHHLLSFSINFGEKLGLKDLIDLSIHLLHLFYLILPAQIGLPVLHYLQQDCLRSGGIRNSVESLSEPLETLMKDLLDKVLNL